MNIPRLADAVGLIDEELVAAQLPPQKRKPVRRVLIAAACAVLLLGTVTALAASGAGTVLLSKLRKGEDGGFESGYNIGAELTRFPEEALTGQIREVPDILRRQIEETTPWSNKLPFTYDCQFDTTAEALEYVGLPELRAVRWELEEQGTNLSVPGNKRGTSLHVLGDERGRILLVSLETSFQEGNVRLQAGAELITEHNSQNYTFSVRTTEDMDFTEENFTAAGGFPCQVLYSSPFESGVVGYDAYLIRAGILYTLNAAYPPSEEARADQLLHVWADQFEPE